MSAAGSCAADPKGVEVKLLLAACLALLPLTAQAQAQAQAQTQAQAPARWVTFTDPTDQAFSLDVPAGWTVHGGIAHRTGTDLSWFVTAVSPDGAMVLRIGDPQLGLVGLPSGQPKPAPSPAPPANDQAAKRQMARRPAIVPDRPYETGADFAASYGKTVVSQLHLCDKPRLVGPQEEPNPPGFTGELGRQVTTGDAFLVCIDRGYVVYVAVTTVLAAPPFDSWDAPRLAVLAAPAAQRADAMRLLRHMADSWSFAPGWVDKMGGAGGPLARQLAALREPPPAADRARWNGQIDAANAAAQRQIDTFMDNAATLCEPDRSMPVPHRCGETGHPPGK